MVAIAHLGSLLAGAVAEAVGDRDWTHVIFSLLHSFNARASNAAATICPRRRLMNRASIRMRRTRRATLLFRPRDPHHRPQGLHQKQRQRAQMRRNGWATHPPRNPARPPAAPPVTASRAVQAPDSYCTVTAQLLHSYCTVTAQLLHEET